jgi:hypothetical protein
MDDFYRTRMGQEFFCGTMPALVRELKRLNDNLERLADTSEKKHEAREPEAQKE